MNNVLHAGRLWRYKKGFFGSNSWKESWMVLRADGQLIIFNDKQCRKVVSHGYNIITCKDSVRVGSEAVRHETNERLPRAPFGDATVDTLFMALPTCADTKKSRGKLRWFYFKSEKDLLKWMRAFSKAIGKDKLFDQIMETIREQELFHLQANPHEIEQSGKYEEISERVGHSIPGESYRQRLSSRNYAKIWSDVVKGTSPANEETETSHPTSRAENTNQTEENIRGEVKDRKPSSTSTEATDEAVTADTGYYSPTPTSPDDSGSHASVTDAHKVTVPVQIHSTSNDHRITASDPQPPDNSNSSTQ